MGSRVWGPVSMIAKWTNADLRVLDSKYAEADIPPHARPLRAAVEILGGGFSISTFGNPEVDAITAAYRALFPNGKATWPGAGIGFAASVDDGRKFTMGVSFGSPSVAIWTALGFDNQQSWWSWCREDAGIAGQAALAFADLHDFTLGCNELGQANKGADDLWHMAASNLADVANNLPTASGVDSVVQPVCLTAELSLKAALHFTGIEPEWKHHLSDLASKLVKARPHRDDVLVAHLVKHFPNYAQSRYKSAGLSRLMVVKLALAAQFVAASSVRRFTSVDLALVMESDSWPGPRQPLLP